MSSSQQAAGRSLIALIADEDSTTGFILSGIGDVTEDGNKNFFVVDNRESFLTFTKERTDIAIVLINQHIADKIRPLVDKYAQAFPALLEIPSKDHPYDPSKDGVLKRVQKVGWAALTQVLRRLVMHSRSSHVDHTQLYRHVLITTITKKNAR